MDILRKEWSPNAEWCPICQNITKLEMLTFIEIDFFAFKKLLKINEFAEFAAAFQLNQLNNTHTN